MEPITFAPLYMERVWGGRELERVYARELPAAGVPYGESWEIVDREEAESKVDTGTWRGAGLHDLWQNHRQEIFGENLPGHTRFPLLIKILDAREDLSIQVHPPAALAAEQGGEPKTEMWFISACQPGAKLYVGLKKGVSRADFERAITAGTVGDCVHAISPDAGESIFIPSGRLHAIGAGFLIHEIQQNSDTTYRVFDWNRTGLDGEPRQLHLPQSLASIDFADTEPAMDAADGEILATCEHFITTRKSIELGESLANPRDDRFSIVTIVSGEFESSGGRRFLPGQTVLLPRDGAPLLALADSVALQITLPD